MYPDMKNERKIKKIFQNFQGLMLQRLKQINIIGLYLCRGRRMSRIDFAQPKNIMKALFSTLCQKSSDPLS